MAPSCRRDARPSALAWAIPKTLALLVTLAGLTAPAAAVTRDGEPYLPADAQPAILALLGEIGYAKIDPETSVMVGQVRIERDSVRFVLVRVDPSTAAQSAVASIDLLARQRAQPGDQLSMSFALRMAVHDDSAPAVKALVARTTAAIIANDRGGLYQHPRVQVEAKPKWQPAARLSQLFAALVAAWLALLLTLAMRHRAGLLRTPWFSGKIAASHLLPATLQLVIFGYWSLYWRALDGSFALELLQEVAFAFALDLLFGLVRTRRLELGVGALPITLSSNLFVIFGENLVWLTLLAIVIALWAKHFVRLPRGHVFNPSALGLAVVGFAVFAIHGRSVGDTAAQFSMAPNATLLILVLATVVQWRLGVAVISIGATIGVMVANFAFGSRIYEPSWAPVTLVLLLLVTDPATSPKAPLERLLFGLFAGVAMRCAGAASLALFDNDFYGKVAGVAIANLFVPTLGVWFDAAASRLRGGHRLRPWLERWLSPRWRLLHIAGLWLLVLAPGALRGDRGHRFVVYDELWRSHLRNQTPCLHIGPDRRPDCARNPLFCDEWSVGQEVWCWRQRRELASSSRSAL